MLSLLQSLLLVFYLSLYFYVLCLMLLSLALSPPLPAVLQRMTLSINRTLPNRNANEIIAPSPGRTSSFISSIVSFRATDTYSTVSTSDS